jgi:hypothetical protein
MSAKKITIDKLAVMIKKGFDENAEQHQKILGTLDKHAVMLIDHTERLKDHTERLKRIETKLEGIVYRKEFEELEARVEEIEKVLVMKKKS